MEYEDLLRRVIFALDKSNLKYVIVGGFAAIYRGRPRTTLDLNLIIEDNNPKFENFLNELKKLDYDIMEEQISMALKEGSHVNIFDKKSILRIDIKIAKKIEDMLTIKEATVEIYKDLKLNLATVEQILYGKISFLGNISDIPDSELLDITDIIDFINVYQQSENFDLEKLRAKLNSKDQLKTLERILKLIKNLK